MIRDRIRQFRATSVLPSAADYGLARDILTPELLLLFDGQHPRDIVHSADTARWLLERGHEDADLLAAALLHDVGKGRQRRIDRTAYVLLEAANLAGIACSKESRWEVRRALERTRTHSLTGAELLAAAGASARVVELTRRHHDSGFPDPVLALLQTADAAS